MPSVAPRVPPRPLQPHFHPRPMAAPPIAATYHKATDLLRVYFGGTEEGSEVESLMLRGDAHSEAAAAGDGDGGHMMSHDAQHAQHFEFGVAPPGAAQQQLQQPFGASWAGATAPGGGSAAPGPTTSFSFNFQ